MAPVNHPSEEVRHFLDDELKRRCRANPAYSLRAFSRALGITSGELSKILSGKRKVSRQKFQLIANRLRLDPEVRRHLENGVVLGRGRPDPLGSLDLDRFRVIADWYHFAILELTLVEDFRPDPSWIGRRLGISPRDVQAAVQRLVEQGFLEVDPDTGAMRDISGSVTTVGHPMTSHAQRLHQHQVLRNSEKALEGVPYERRDHSSVTLAIDSARLPEFQKLIKRFRRDLIKLAQPAPRYDAVYQLGVAFFPLTRIEETEE